MKIGEYEVKNVTRDGAEVGCQRVTKAQVEQLLKEINSAPEEFVVTNGPSDEPGSVWLEKSGNGVTLYLRTKTRSRYHILKLTPEGIYRSTYCDGCGIPTESTPLMHEAVKIVGTH